MKRTSVKNWLVVLVLCALWRAGYAELAYQHMNDPARDAWQKPKEVIQQLAIPPGSHVADLGAGGGYFTWHLADAVGPGGRVYVVEINETGLAIIEREMDARGITNVVPVMAEPHDAKLPEPVDLVFTCDSYHHMADRVTYFRSLARYLKPGGGWRFWIFTPMACLPVCSAMERPKKWSGTKWRPPAIGCSRFPAHREPTLPDLFPVRRLNSRQPALMTDDLRFQNQATLRLYAGSRGARERASSTR